MKSKTKQLIGIGLVGLSLGGPVATLLEKNNLNSFIVLLVIASLGGSFIRSSFISKRHSDGSVDTK